jgi:secretion/DNA translocation related TadE-like protein
MTVWMAAGLGLLAMVAGAMFVLIGAVGARHRAEQAADLAALAAAGAAQRAGAPGALSACEAARQVAAGNGAMLTGCHTLGAGDFLVTVRMAMPAALARWVRGYAVAEARAGP